MCSRGPTWMMPASLMRRRCRLTRRSRAQRPTRPRAIPDVAPRQSMTRFHARRDRIAHARALRGCVRQSHACPFEQQLAAITRPRPREPPKISTDLPAKSIARRDLKNRLSASAPLSAPTVQAIARLLLMVFIAAPEMRRVRGVCSLQTLSRDSAAIVASRLQHERYESPGARWLLGMAVQALAR